MVFCGKPSRACLECRVKRRECDLSKPACRQCVRAGSRCDGYRDQSSLTFRDQTMESMSKPQIISHSSSPVISFHRNQAVFTGTARCQQATAYQSKEGHDNDLWTRISPQQLALGFFSHHYLLSGSGRAISHRDCVSIMYTRATECGYLADLINAVGVVSLAHVRNAPSLTLAGGQLYSAALRHMRVALSDPAEASSDQMLIAVMLLVLYETVICNPDNSLSSWDRHVDGALALVELRGIGQLRNRVGRSIFLNLRTEVLISCLQRRLDVPVTLTKWMNEARIFESAKEAPAGLLAGIIVSACAALASVKDRAMDKLNISDCISALLSIDEALERWAKSLTAEYGYKTSRIPGNHADVFLERHYLYPGIEMAHTWNLQRCARITLRQALTEMLSLHIGLPSTQSTLSSLYYRQLLQTSDIIIEQNSNDICYSVPYIFQYCDKPGRSGDIRAACIRSLLWPLYVAGTAHTTTSATRGWVIVQLKKIAGVAGIQKAKFMALDIQKGCSP